MVESQEEEEEEEGEKKEAQERDAFSPTKEHILAQPKFVNNRINKAKGAATWRA